jgi:hypothetical protein
MKARERRRPSFDSITGGYPTVDLHVADVPYGSRSRAQVEIEARVGGWFGTAVFSSWLASAILLFAYLARPQLAIGSTLLMSFAAGLAVLLVRQDPHRLVTRLLSKVRLLATFAALLALAAAVVMASNNPDSTHGWLLALFIASLTPTSLISASWLLALRRSLRDNPKESPWEHHRPRGKWKRKTIPMTGRTISSDFFSRLYAWPPVRANDTCISGTRLSPVHFMTASRHTSR